MVSLRLSRTKYRYKLICVVVVFLACYVASPHVLASLGHFLVVSEQPEESEAVVVLYTGVEYYSRLVEAAELYRQGYVSQVVINGNRKSDVLRSLEASGYRYQYPWHDDYIAILNFLGVPTEAILCISAEDVYDTVSEADVVGNALIKHGIHKIILTTSKSHTRRSRYIWENSFDDSIEIVVIAAKEDPFLVNGWWKHGRQIKWVLSEYGAWLYYFWKRGFGL